MSKIEWTDVTWNPTRGCSKVSEGCRNCYAMRQAHRMNHPGGSYEGLTKLVNGKPEWTGDVRLVPEKLEDPLRWRKPRRVFVDSMSDLFHPEVPFKFIAAVFGIMRRCPQHTFQILTKRPARAAAWFRWMGTLVGENSITGEKIVGPACDPVLGVQLALGNYLHLPRFPARIVTGEPTYRDWPLPNVWLGTSVEDQATADERIPHLLRCPAVVRFLSCEPLLGPVGLEAMWMTCPRCEGSMSVPVEGGGKPCPDCYSPPVQGVIPGIHWLILGGESGPGSRACDVAWIRDLVKQGKDAGVPVFVKQLGASWYEQMALVSPNNRKGGDPSEWPEDLRVREFPLQPVGTP